MKPRIAILSVLFVLFAVASCTKDKDHANEGTILTRYTTSFKDTIDFYYIYDRDANGKIISMRDSTKGYEYTTKLEYGSNGKVTKVNFIQLGANPIYSFEFEYNSDGRISKRNTRAGTLNVSEDYNVYVYDASGHLTVDSQYVKLGTGGYKLIRIAKFQYTGDNITVAENYDVSTGAPVLGDKLKYDYDNSVNPFKGLEYEYYINEAGSAIYTVVLKSGNNVLKQYLSDGNGGWDAQYAVNYQYNSNNYAWKATGQNVTVTQPPLTTEYFFQ